MTIDTELIAQVQKLADEACSHRVRSLIACYVGFISLLESNPELKDRAVKLENSLRAFRATGILPPSSTESTALTPNRRAATNVPAPDVSRIHHVDMPLARADCPLRERSLVD